MKCRLAVLNVNVEHCSAVHTAYGFPWEVLLTPMRAQHDRI